MSFTHKIQVKEEDIDQMNHVNNVVYVRYVQEVAENHWYSIATTDLQSQVVWVVIRHEIDYKKPAFLNDIIIGETWIEKPLGPKMQRYVSLKNIDGEEIVKAKTTWCALNAKTHRPLRITDELYNMFI